VATYSDACVPSAIGRSAGSGNLGMQIVPLLVSFKGIEVRVML